MELDVRIWMKCLEKELFKLQELLGLNFSGCFKAQDLDN